MKYCPNGKLQLDIFFPVDLKCSSKLMTAKLTFGGQNIDRFDEWILVGPTLNHVNPDCKLQGTGDLQYLIEIPVSAEPCGTKMVFIYFVISFFLSFLFFLSFFQFSDVNVVLNN